MSDSQAFCVCFLLSLFFKYHECWIFGRRKPLIVHIYIYITKIQIFAYINIDKHFGKSSHSRQHTTISVYEMFFPPLHFKKVNVMGWKVYHFIFVGKSILSFISTWLRFSYTCHKGCLNTWLGDRKLREAKLRCFFKASKTVASPGRWLMWCTAKTLRSTDHVGKFKERYHPHPTPPQSHDLRSTDHVCKFKERYHPHPTPPQLHIYKPPWRRSSRWTSCP